MNFLSFPYSNQYVWPFSIFLSFLLLLFYNYLFIPSILLIPTAHISPLCFFSTCFFFIPSFFLTVLPLSLCSLILSLLVSSDPSSLEALLSSLFYSLHCLFIVSSFTACSQAFTYQSSISLISHFTLLSIIPSFFTFILDPSLMPITVTTLDET